MISDFDLARRLFPRAADVVREATAGVPATSQVRGTATGDSADGTVTVVLETEAGGETAEMEVPTIGGVTEGSEVLVTLLDGTPVDCTRAGSVDETWGAATAAEAAAEAAQAVADAVGQHFWHDTDGAHVTQVTQQDWNDSGGIRYHSGPNSLWNAFGVLFRDGLTNLLAVLTNGVAIYDGNGNAASNVVASFSASETHIGRGGEGAVYLANDAFAITASSSTDELDPELTVSTADMRIDDANDSYEFGAAIKVSTHRHESVTASNLVDMTMEASIDQNMGTYVLPVSKAGVSSTAYADGSDSTTLVYADHVELDADEISLKGSTLRLTYGTGGSAEVTNHDMADVQDALNGTYHLDAVQNVNASGNTYFTAERTDTGNRTMFGIGAGGDNRGVWDESLGAWAWYLDANDRLHIPQWSMKRHDAQTSSAVSVANNANRSIVTLSVSGDEGDVVGMWLLIGHVKFQSNTSGRRVAGVTTSANASLAITATNTVITQPPTNGAETAMVLFDTFTINYGTTSWARYLTVWQNSGSALNCEGSLKAIRIGMP